MNRLLPITLLALLAAAPACSSFGGFFEGGTTRDIKETRTGTCEGDDCGAVATPDSSSAAAWTFYEEPVEVAEDEVTFASRGTTLRGTLLRPKSSTAAVPGVVLVHDWGPQGRDGVMRNAFGLELPVEVPVYRTLAETLASHGFAVLIYDKRTCVRGGPPWCTYPREALTENEADLMRALVDDARSAARFLAARSDVDADLIALVGHGQGAEIATALVDGPDIVASSVILLNPSAYPVDENVMHQTDASIDAITARLKNEKSSAVTDELQRQLEELKKNRDEQAATFKALREGSRDDAYGLPADVWRQVFELHERQMQALPRIDVPLLVVSGEADLDYPEDNTVVIEARLEKNAAKPVLSAQGGLTHLLVDVEEDPTTLSPEVGKVMVEFLRKIEPFSRDTAP